MPVLPLKRATGTGPRGLFTPRLQLLLALPPTADMGPAFQVPHGSGWELTSLPSLFLHLRIFVGLKVCCRFGLFGFNLLVFPVSTPLKDLNDSRGGQRQLICFFVTQVRPYILACTHRN
jgi:hypothetical protein